MFRPILAAAVAVLVLLNAQTVFAQEENGAVDEVIIEGTVESLSLDNGVLIVDDKEIFLPEQDRYDWYLEEGDSVKVVAKRTSTGLVGVDYDFIWDDEPYDEEEFDTEYNE